jgi:hypothetical protein
VSRFSQLIDEVSDPKNRSLSEVLLKAKVLAHQLRSRKFRQWVEWELEGYETADALPDYRVVGSKIYGDFAGYFQSQIRNVPLSTHSFDPDIRRVFDTERIPDSVAYIEDLCRNKDGRPGKSLDMRCVSFLRQYGEQIEGMILNHVQKLIPMHAFVSLLHSIRSRLLDFLLDLRAKHPDLDRTDEAVTAISEAEVDAAVEHKVYNQCTVVEGAAVRDVYQAGQAGAMGPGAKAENINFIQILRDAIGSASLLDLAKELEALRGSMLAEAKTAEQDEAVAAVANAEDAAKKGDAKGVMTYLAAGGKWVGEMVGKVGSEVLAKVIEKAVLPG